MKAPKALYQNGTLTPAADWLKALSKELSAKKSDKLDKFLDIAMQGFEPDYSEIEDADEAKRQKALFKGVEKAWKSHVKAKADAEKAAQKQKEEAEQRGMKIIVAAKKGEKIAEAIASDMVGNLSKAMKGKFVMEGMSLKLAKGAKPTEADFSEVLGALSNLKGAATEAADQAGFYMADAITLANEAGFNGNQLLEQVAKEFGVRLFTAQQAQRLGEFFPPEARIPGLSMSGHQEIMYGASAVKDPKKLEAVIEKIKEGKVIDVTTTANGKELTDRKPYSKSEVRRLMDEAAGHKPKKRAAAGGAAGCPTGNFLYLTSDEHDNDVFYISDLLSMKACADPSFAVLDLMMLTQLDAKGNPKHHLEQLPEQYKDEVPAPKAKKPKKAEAEPTHEEGVPEQEDDVPAAVESFDEIPA